MKLSIISRDKSALHIRALLRAARNNNLAAEVVELKDFEDFKTKAPALGEVVYWRTSGLDIHSERAAVGPYLKGKHVINRALFERPYVTHKFYQQATIAAAGVSGIDTYRFRTKSELKAALAQGRLSLPLIAKPNLGAHGIGVSLLKTRADINSLVDCKNLVFQRYIQNQGDWRVIMLGGRALGVMKRTAKAGSVLNNVFQGGATSLEADPAVLGAVITIATEATAALDLVFCGVDVIRDEASGTYHFLEINTAPEWLKGFQPISGVNVADELIKYCTEIGARGHKPLATVIEAYYNNSLGTPGLDADSVFHFASRLYLWTGGAKAKPLIKKIQGDYLGNTELATKQKLEAYLSKELPVSKIAHRRRHFIKYPKLRAYNRILFKVLFAENIYNLDLRSIVKTLGIEVELARLYQVVGQDKKAIQSLSTHAINFLFLVENYFKRQPKLLGRGRFDYKRCLIDNAEELSLQMEHGRQTADSLKLGIYTISHIIIGQSNYYARPVTGQAYAQVLKSLDKIIAQNYFSLSLDIKLEFLVCAKLCGYTAELTPLIRAEVESSLSEVGNFLVDTYNQSAHLRPMKNRLWQSEHRSVLYLMSVLPYQSVRGSRTNKVGGK